MAAAVTENTSTAIPKAPRRTEMAPTRASGGLYHPAIITRATHRPEGVSPNPRKFRQVKFSPATISSRSITCPLSRKV